MRDVRAIPTAREWLMFAEECAEERVSEARLNRCAAYGWRRRVSWSPPKTIIDRESKSLEINMRSYSSSARQRLLRTFYRTIELRKGVVCSKVWWLVSRKVLACLSFSTGQ